MPFRELVDYIQDGEPVEAATPNRPLRELDLNTRYLRDILEEILAGRTLIAYNQPLDEDVLIGQAVYFDSDAQEYRAAIGRVVLDNSAQSLVTDSSSYVAGVVLRKPTATTADVLLQGLADVDLSQAVTGTVTPGLYYLSNSEAGKLTIVRPPVAVSVLRVLQTGTAAGTHQALVHPNWIDFLEAHRHYLFELETDPAGDHTPPLVGGIHTITNADDSLEGWLPADHAIFEGLAPAGAKFGYNLSASALKDLWPPVPLTGAIARLVRPVSLAGGELVSNEFLVLDENGLWWMSDCYDEVPWPVDLDTTVSQSVSEPDCPTTVEHLMQLWWTGLLFQTDSSVVLSLRAKENSGLRVLCFGTDDEQAVGDLELDLDLGLLVSSDDDAPGHLVFKTLEDNQFTRGPVVSSIRSVSPELIITSSVDETGEDGEMYADVVLQANLDIDNLELSINQVGLDGAEISEYQNTLAVLFPSGHEAAFRGSLDVPARLTIPDGVVLKLRFWVLGRVAGTYPADMLTLTYRLLSRPAAILTAPVTLTTTDTALAMACDATIGIDQYVEMESDGIVVAAGDQLLFTLTRGAPDAFVSDAYLVKQYGVLVTT